MKRTVLATLIALSIPAAASADESRMMQPPMPRPPAEATATFHGDRRDVRELDRLEARYAEAASLRDRRAMARLEEKLLAAIDGELAEARATLASLGRGRHGNEYRHRQGAFERRRVEAAWAELHRLTSLRDEFVDLQGRFGRRATSRKLAVVAEVSRLARADLAALPPPTPRYPVAWNDHR